jgi:hypothetical protein
VTAVKTGARLAGRDASKKEVAEVKRQAKAVAAAALDEKETCYRAFDRGVLPDLDFFVKSLAGSAAQVALLCIDPSPWEAAREAMLKSPGCLANVGQIEVFRAVNQVALESLGLPFIELDGGD